MKRRNAKMLTMFISLCFLAVAFLKGACGGSASGTNENETGLTAPTMETVRTALSTNNPFGLVPGLALGEITLPECTDTTDSANITYSISDLPSWLSFDATTRALTLAEGNAVVPDEAYTLSEVTYTCAETSETTTANVPTPTSLSKATTSTTSTSFPVNDLDGGGVVDGREYEFGEVPLLNPTMGWMWLTPGNVDLYRTADTTTYKIPTGIMITAVGMDPTDAADDTGDFDGDGSNNGDEITNGTDMFVATSDGTFAVSSTPAAGATPKAIAAADLDNDGDLDLVVTNEEGLNAASIRPFLNNGSGTFTAGTDYDTVSFSEGLTSADLDGDGNMDVAATDPANDVVRIFMGNGDGTFDAQVPYATGSAPSDTVAADFNGDGEVDLAAANAGSDNVSILLGDGDGTFGAAVNVDISGANPEPYGLAFADLDDDGDIDLAVCALAAPSMSILTNDGGGNFTETATYAPDNDCRSIAAADFNGDGAIDLAVMVWTGAEDINIFLNNGDGTFAAPTAVPFSDKPYDIVAGDFNGDGNIDLAATAHSGDVVGVFLSNGDGTFAAVVEYAVNAGPWGIVAADFNANGQLDLAVANSGLGGDTLSVILNQ